MFIIECVLFLSLLLDVVRREVLLEVKVSHLNVRGRREKIAKLVVEDDLATVVGVLEAVVDDVLVDDLGHLGARDELTCGKSKELAQLRRHILLTVESVVSGASLSLLTIGIFLGVLDLTNELGEVLDIGAEGGKLGLNGFERHYIYLIRLVFKLLKKYIAVNVTISHNIKRYTLG
jgi:hypothetical protein